MKTHLIILIFCVLAAALFNLPCYGASEGRNPGFVVGYGLSFAVSDDYRTNDIFGDGIFFKGEYGLQHSREFETRLYAGGVFTSAKSARGVGEVSPSNVSTSMGFVGAKIHFVLPVPKVAPFVEVGVGGSFGSLTTQIGDLYNEDHSGLAVHIPFTLGLAFGDIRKVEVSFSYLFYPSFDHVDGSLAVGVHFGIPAKPSKSNSVSDFDLH